MPKTPWADRYRAAPTNKSNVMRTIILLTVKEDGARIKLIQVIFGLILKREDE